VAIADIAEDRATQIATKIGPCASGHGLDVFDRVSIEGCRDAIYDAYGRVDILFNCVGGNMRGATTSPDLSFFDLPEDALRRVIDLNLIGGVIVPTQVFGSRMKDQDGGVSIVNVSSMNALRPLTRIPGYSAAKAAVSNFTQWLAVHLAQEYGPHLRVNAIAPGFFLTEQNRYLLTDADSGELTPRGRQIIDHTPLGAFGEPDDLAGVAVWLASEASRFVTGVVVPIDGGFSAYSGV
jgi:NAD(P)-dependent dehydrogenase (short-subunit alcohol dehydrogenase family)